ncbi:MAG: DUF4954 domain-containing protein [Saprospiraceae bacterium]|nr:MAG: DUF4954 domain-containing protein [Saprospiraceae bacterium]
MHKISKKPLEKIGYDFVDPIYLEEGTDEFYIRNQQFGKTDHFRVLTRPEIEVLLQHKNEADDWNSILVKDPFDPNLVKNCHFHGKIRIGTLAPYYLEHHDLKLPVGLYNSTIISCDIGDNSVIKNVHYLAHYIIGNEAILYNINEMHTTSHAKFGNGILKQGENDNLRTWLEVCNENGRRNILPFDGMLPADAWLWAKFRDDDQLMNRFLKMTDDQFDVRPGYYGTIGDQCVIKNTQIIKDVKVGSHAYIKGANKLKNLTINSSLSAPSQIGEGVELVNGIMGYGSRAFYGVKAVRFILGENSTLKYGARLINSLLGDNSTISCCEVLNSLIFPGHEQHHNNSFLIAATVLGQSNVAAGATIGSNHNSRGADGEILAGRGFWPGLSVSLKHNSKFASFCLLANGNFTSELDIPLPFSLISNSEHDNCLNVMPAFWWMYNMYALARNAWKYADRDKRIYKVQTFECDYLAPDTVGEIFQAMHLLVSYTEKAFLKQFPEETTSNPTDLPLGKYLLLHKADKLKQLKILGEKMENSSREVRLIKVPQAYVAYRKMLHYYGIKTLLEFGETTGKRDWGTLKATFAGSKRVKWFNLGGQLIPQSDLETLLQEIQAHKICSWKEIHQHYSKFDQQYTQQNAANAFASLLELYNLDEDKADLATWHQWLGQAVETAYEIARKTKESRKKDYSNAFRQNTFDSIEEMNAVQGPIDENMFIQQMEAEARMFEERVSRWVR